MFFMTQALKVGNESNFFSQVKGIYGKPTANNSKVKGYMLNVLCLIWQTKQKS